MKMFINSFIPYYCGVHIPEVYQKIEEIKCNIAKALMEVFNSTEEEASKYVANKYKLAFEYAQTTREPNTKIVLDELENVYSKLLRGDKE